MLQEQPQLPANVYTEAWEVGRLVLAPEYRAKPEILRTCFFLTLMRFIELTPSANFLATCNPILSRLYRRFGFSVLVKNALQKAGETYSLIHGNVASVQLAVSASAAQGGAQ